MIRKVDFRVGAISLTNEYCIRGEILGDNVEELGEILKNILKTVSTTQSLPTPNPDPIPVSFPVRVLKYKRYGQETPMP